MKKERNKKPLVSFFAKVREDHLTKLAARAKKEKKSQGELLRELLDRHL